MNKANNEITIEYGSGTYYLARANGAGVFVGHVVAKKGDEVAMTNARRLYEWVGATELCQLAMEGVKSPDVCKFTMSTDYVVLLNVVEIQKCTAEAAANLMGVRVWKT